MVKLISILKGKRLLPIVIILGLMSCTAPEIPDATHGHYSLAFSLPTAGEVKVVISNRFDTVVKTLGPYDYSPGMYSLGWDQLDEDDELVPIGLYFAVLFVDGKQLGKTATLNLFNATEG